MSFKRKMILSDYCNLGIESDGPATLILDQNAEKGYLGNLVVLVGPNNSGKSNVLDALTSLFSNAAVSADLKPDFIFDKETTAKVSFSVTDGTETFIYTKTSASSTPTWEHIKKATEEKKITQDDVIKYLEAASNFARSYVGDPYYTQAANALAKAKDKGLSEDELAGFINNFGKTINNVVNSSGSAGRATYQNQISQSIKDKYHVGIPGANAQQTVAAEFEKKFGYAFVPNIHLYAESKLGNNSLSVSPNNPAANALFNSLFNSIGLPIDEIRKVYAAYSQTHNISLLTRLENKVKPKIQLIVDRFNNLYFSHDEHFKYDFELKFENNLISFGLMQGNKVINLEKQSTGFRYFFDLFFNYLNNSPCNPGDILIMDEPGTCLHVKGQEELRSFLKEFAMKNDLTIVISTHSPFLVDPNNLDEVRMVVPTSNGSLINNDFYYSNDDDPDTLTPIANALTTRNSVVLDPDKKLMLVEGITDYNYITGFANSLGIVDLVFLPINGLGKKGDQKDRIGKLLKIRRDATLLADGDTAGQKSKEAAKDTGLTVVCLDEIDPSWKEIEDLFDKKDAEAFSLPNKKSGESEALKAALINHKYSFSDKTVSNFKKLLKYLEDN